MRLCWIAPDFAVTNEARTALASAGHEIVPACDGKTDAMLVMSISQLDAGQEQHYTHPAIPVFNYCWDLYSWVWTRPRHGEYDYAAYGDFLAASREVWCPSICTAKSITHWYGPHVRTAIIKTAITRWEPDEVADDGYILQPIREQPDHLWGECEAAAKRLGLRIISSDHRLTFEEYKRAVSRCSFIASPLWELSTGGLTLLEGHRIGKHCLVMDSPHNGAREYLLDRAGVSYAPRERFAAMMEFFSSPTRKKFDVEAAREFIDGRYNAQQMARDIETRLELTL